MDLHNLITTNSNISSAEDRDKNTNTGVIFKSTKGIQQVTTKIINSREELASFLLTKNIKLVTSFTEVVSTGSFIKSSYVIYLDFANKSETFGDFLVRYPELEKIAYLIENYNH
jgi:hypothetical protein